MDKRRTDCRRGNMQLALFFFYINIIFTERNLTLIDGMISRTELMKTELAD